jgi:hypothetical protein
MRAQPGQPGSARPLLVRLRLENVCTRSRLFVLGVTTQQSLEAAARFSSLHPSPCAQMVQAHRHGAVSTRESLSKTPAQPVATARHQVQERPWALALVVASTLPQRARRHPANAKTCPHGHGCVVGQQWPTSGLLRHARLSPRRPSPC